METGIVMAGMVVLVVMVLAAAYMRANRRPPVAVTAPLGLQNPNAVLRSSITADNAVNLGYSIVEMTTPNSHIISLTPQSAERVDADVLRQEIDAAGSRRIGVARVRYDRLGG